MSVENLSTDPSASVSFLNNLRTKTASSHEGLEALPISKSIVHPNITIENYTQYLSLMHDVVQNLEENIYPILSNVILDLTERKKAHLLLNDLKNTGHIKTKNASPFKETSTISIPFAMGIMYVIEGSTLGGRFILKNVQENLGFSEENGASYFSGYGNKTGSFWKTYLNLLTTFASQNNSEEEIIAGADYAFQIVSKHLSENAPS